MALHSHYFAKPFDRSLWLMALDHYPPGVLELDASNAADARLMEERVPNSGLEFSSTKCVDGGSNLLSVISPKDCQFDVCRGWFPFAQMSCDHLGRIGSNHLCEFCPIDS